MISNPLIKKFGEFALETRKAGSNAHTFNGDDLRLMLKNAKDRLNLLSAHYTKT
jgi:hypothetical protein